MNMNTTLLNRRDFTKTTLLAGAADASGTINDIAADPKRIRIGIIGCGSVSGSYLPVLTKCPFAEVVSLCDIRPERAERRAKRWVSGSRPNVREPQHATPPAARMSRCRG